MIDAQLERTIAQLILDKAEAIIIPAARDIKNVTILDAGPDKATEIDEAMEEALLIHLVPLIENAKAFGEEGVKKDPAAIQRHLAGYGHLFIADALDGTNYFVRQDGGYGAMVSLLHRDNASHDWQVIGAWIYDVHGHTMTVLSDPAIAPEHRARPKVVIGYEDRLLSQLTDEQLNALPFDSAGRGPAACVCVQQCHAGLVDGIVHPVTSPWDHFAGIALLQKAGFTICDWRGRPVTYRHPMDGIVFARTPELAETILKNLVPQLRR